MNEETKYTITVTENQVRVINQALDLLARVGIGQISDFVSTLPLKRNVSEYDLIEDIRNILRGNMKHDIDGWHSHLGITHQDAPMFAKQAWDMQQTFRHRLSWDRAVKDGIVKSLDSPREFSKMMTVDYDDPFYISDDQPATIQKMDD